MCLVSQFFSVHPPMNFSVGVERVASSRFTISAPTNCKVDVCLVFFIVSFPCFFIFLLSSSLFLLFSPFFPFHILFYFFPLFSSSLFPFILSFPPFATFLSLSHALFYFFSSFSNFFFPFSFFLFSFFVNFLLWSLFSLSRSLFFVYFPLFSFPLLFFECLKFWFCVKFQVTFFFVLFSASTNHKNILSLLSSFSSSPSNEASRDSIIHRFCVCKGSNCCRGRTKGIKRESNHPRRVESFFI